MSWINGKTVIITGTSSGIGSYLAAELIKKYDCKVIGIGRDEIAMKSMVHDCLSFYSDNFSYKIFDVSVENNWKIFKEYLIRNNIKPDILINNAGTMPAYDSFPNYTQKEIDNVFAVNVFAPMYAIRELLPLIKESRTPGIVNISSSAALSPMAGTSVYSASKAAILNFTEGLIGELGREIYIGVVCPGVSMTGIFRNQRHKETGKYAGVISTPPDVMAHKIIKGIKKEKHRMIIGADAKAKNIFSKLFPVLSIKTYEIILKKFGSDMFSDVFKR